MENLVQTCNSGDITQYIYVNNKPDVVCDCYTPALISIGYFENGENAACTKEFPHIDIDIYIDGTINIYNYISLVRHFGNDPGKLYDLYNDIIPLVNAARSSMHNIDVFSNVTDKIFETLKTWSHKIYLKNINGMVLKHDPSMSDLKYGSTFLGFTRRLDGKLYSYKLITLNDRIEDNEPIVWLHRVTLNVDIEFLIYPNGNIIINNPPFRMSFDDIREFGGVRILEFCKDCNNLYNLYIKNLNEDNGIYKLHGNNLNCKNSYKKYENLVRKLLQDLSSGHM